MTAAPNTHNADKLPAHPIVSGVKSPGVGEYYGVSKITPPEFPEITDKSKIVGIILISFHYFA
jgi:hypothetical protein